MFIKADASANMQTSFRFLKKERKKHNQSPHQSIDLSCERS